MDTTPGILDVLRESRILTANNRETFIRDLPYLCDRRPWDLHASDTDPMTIRGRFFDDLKPLHQDFFVLYNTKATWVQDGQWCFIAADATYRQFVLAWRIGRSTLQPHKTWFAFVDPDTAYTQACAGDFRHFEKRSIYECIMLDAPLACPSRRRRAFLRMLGEPREAAPEGAIDIAA